VKIGYITTYDPHDVNNWSGLGFFIGQSLIESGLELEFLGPLTRPRSFPLLAKRAFHRLLVDDDYLWERSTSVGRSYAREIVRRLQSIEIDAVFSPGSIPVALLDVPQPVVFWTDATFAAMRDFYPEYSGLAPISIRESEELERAALDRANLVVYASDWAAASAIEHYRADPAKVKVVPFGANLDREIVREDAARAIDARSNDRCKLLFVGVDWKRKGADLAVTVARDLNRANIPTDLVVVGSTFPVPTDAQPFITFSGFIDKRSPEGRRRLESLFKTSHFLIHPARAECYGVALCEANAFGVPCIATKVGGIPTIVRHGVNGLLLEADASPADFVEQIRPLMSDWERYRHLAQTSHEEYRTRLNWQTSGQRVRSLIEQLPRNKN
jgi:glycosyltransferase involved in cell wall biosynthesis